MATWCFLLLGILVTCDDIPTIPIYNDGVQYADVAIRSYQLESFGVDEDSGEWIQLSKQGQFARGSVVPADEIVAGVRLVGGFDTYPAKSQGDGIYGCNLSDFEGDFKAKFAIMYRGKCKFEDKVINAAQNGAVGMVVVNDQPEGVITMSIGDAKDQNLVSIMINNNDGKEVLLNLQQSNHTLNMRIMRGAPQVGFEKVIVIVICLAFLVLLTISLAWVIFYYVQRFRILHRQYTAQKRQEKLMRKALDSLRVETLKPTSDLVRNHEETCCAICIDNFEAGVEVRHLTCGHPYHKKCIDPWLMEKGTCPQCKVDVLKQLGLRDSDTFAEPPSESSPPVETNDAFYDEDVDVSADQNDEMNDSGVEDGANDQNGDEDHPGDADFCNINASQFTWFNHSQLNRAMSEPLPPVDQTNISMRGSMFRNTQLSALPSTAYSENVSELDERQPRTQF